MIEMAMVAAHLSHSSFDDVCGWSLRQIVGVVSRADRVMPLINPLAVPNETPKETPAEAHKAIAHAFGLVKP